MNWIKKHWIKFKYRNMKQEVCSGYYRRERLSREYNICCYVDGSRVHKKKVKLYEFNPFNQYNFHYLLGSK